MKKVIFIGGTSFSGSTLLDMIISNDPNGFSLGEISALFRPYRKHHFEERKRVNKDEHWSEILGGGERNLYKNLFNQFSEIEFFVDSSKDPFWINAQMKNIENSEIEYKNILIYKTPQELAHSYAKRGRIKEFEKGIVSYYKSYLYLIKNFKTISYKQLVKDKNSLKKLCDYINIEYFQEKTCYWEKEHNTFFGNNRARIHTSNLKLKGKEKAENLMQEGKKKIYYKEPKQQIFMEFGNIF